LRKEGTQLAAPPSLNTPITSEGSRKSRGSQNKPPHVFGPQQQERGAALAAFHFLHDITTIIYLF
jgi:hypothetical protein